MIRNSLYPIQFEIVHLQGYIAIAAYVHYFTPGSIRIQTKRRIVQFFQFKEPLDAGAAAEEFLGDTRRWLPKGEAPYPGYCRAPGSNTCIPQLCNCAKLKEIWKQINNIKKVIDSH